MQKKYILLTLLFLYAALVFFGLYHHEPWRDEAHAWVHARDATLTQVIDDIQYEGVPILYYVLLMPFAKLGLPFGAMKVVHGSLAVAAVGLLLFFGELPIALKILFMFSYFMAFEYGVITRNYILTALLLFAIAAMYTRRLDRPVRYGILIALLYQTNLHSFGSAAALTFLYCWDIVRKKIITFRRMFGLSCMIAALIFTVYTYLRGPVAGFDQSVRPSIEVLYESTLVSAIVPFLPRYTPIIFRVLPFNFFILITVYILIGSLFVMVWKNKSILFLASTQLGWILFINIFVHPANLRHRGLLLISIIFLLWIAHKTIGLHTWPHSLARTICIGALGFLLLLSWPYTFFIYRMDYQYNFSGSSDMARYIGTQGLDSKIIATYISSFTETVLANFPEKRFWYAEYGDFGYRDVADLRYHAVFAKSNVTPDAVAAKARVTFPDETGLLLLLSSPLKYPGSDGFTLLHTSPSVFFWEQPTENFWLYSRNPGKSLDEN